MDKMTWLPNSSRSTANFIQIQKSSSVLRHCSVC